MSNAKTISQESSTVEEALTALDQGRLVGLPTETVYGLAADATKGQAVAGIFAAKGRPQFNPLIVHVKNSAKAAELVDFSPMADKLATAFWPGPFTMVLPHKSTSPVHPLVTADLDTLAVRVPAHRLAQELLAKYGHPLAAPSANPSGAISPTTAQHVRDGLGGKVAAILDGGPCDAGIESTIVKFEGDDVILLRPGSITPDMIAAVTGRPPVIGKGTPGTVEAPGQLRSHYAPTKPLRLNAHDICGGEALLQFGPAPATAAAHDAPLFPLSATGDLTEAAANLFAQLRAADASDAAAIAVMPIPMDGLGIAINDRLGRAAHD
ncbi:MAG: L-threonylcarbamoyladenylate synthase [Alphaproteobacteria bacterium]